MTLADQHVPVAAWDEPGGLIPRGTVVVIPGRGETPAVYERFGRRLAGDAYRVRAVTDPVVDAGLARAQVSGRRRRRAVPGTAPAGRWPAPDCGLGAAGLMMNGRAPRLGDPAPPEHQRRVLVMC